MLNTLLSHGRNGTRPSIEPATSMLFSVAGDQAKIDGDFRIADSLEIQCEIGGTLEVGKKMVILERGVVHAEVQTVDAVIMGTFEGDLVATGNVAITETGRVSGHITTNSLTISRGGVFTGTVTKIDDPEAREIPIKQATSEWGPGRG